MKRLLTATVLLFALTANAQFNYPSAAPMWFYLARIAAPSFDTTTYSAASFPGIYQFRQQPGDTGYYFSNGKRYLKVGTGAPVTVSNGLTQVGEDIRWGGNLTGPTTVNCQGIPLNFVNTDVGNNFYRITMGNALTLFSQVGGTGRYAEGAWTGAGAVYLRSNNNGQSGQDARITVDGAGVSTIGSFSLGTDDASAGAYKLLTRNNSTGRVETVAPAALPAATLQQVATAGNTTSLSILSGNGTVTNRLFYNATGGILGTTSNHPTLFFTNNTEKMRILANGNVGIGRTSPSDKFEVFGNIVAQQNAGAGNKAVLGADANNGFIRFETEFGILGGKIGGQPNTLMYDAEDLGSHTFVGGPILVGPPGATPADANIHSRKIVLGAVSGGGGNEGELTTDYIHATNTVLPLTLSFAGPSIARQMFKDNNIVFTYGGTFPTSPSAFFNVLSPTTLPGAIAFFEGRVKGLAAVNGDEFATLSQLNYQGIRDITSSTTVTATDHTLINKSTAGNPIITLLTGAAETGRVITIIEGAADPTTNGCSWTPAVRVDGSTTATSFATLGSSRRMTIQYDGSEWWIKSF